MIICPQCKNTLPDWTQMCQFCKTDVTTVSRPVSAKTDNRSYMGQTAQWIWPTYYAICGYIILGGVIGVIQGLTGSHRDFFVTFGLVIEILTIGYGICLIMQVDFIRSLAMYLTAFWAMFAIINTFQLIGSYLALKATVSNKDINNLFHVAGQPNLVENLKHALAWAPFFIMKSFVDIAAAILLMYLLYETEYNY